MIKQEILALHTSLKTRQFKCSDILYLDPRIKNIIVEKKQ